jgi:hypothetical protein
MFHAYVSNVLSECCVSLQWFSSVFASVSNVCFSCFKRMLQVLDLDGVKLDLMLLILQCDPPTAAARVLSSRQGLGGKRRGRELSSCGDEWRGPRVAHSKWSAGAGFCSDVGRYHCRFVFQDLGGWGEQRH